MAYITTIIYEDKLIILKVYVNNIIEIRFTKTSTWFNIMHKYIVNIYPYNLDNVRNI